MFARIALLLGVLAVPVLLALASQTLAATTKPPELPESLAPGVTTVPAVAPSTPGGIPSASRGIPQAPSAVPAATPRAVEAEPRQVGTPADLDGDRDDDGIPDEVDG